MNYPNLSQVASRGGSRGQGVNSDLFTLKPGFFPLYHPTSSWAIGILDGKELKPSLICIILGTKTFVDDSSSSKFFSPLHILTAGKMCSGPGKYI